MKAICFKDVRPGDVVCQQIGGELFEIEKTELRSWHYPVSILWVKGQVIPIQDLPDRFIGLVHRPWPEGKTEHDMLDEVIGVAFQVTRGAVPQRVLELREAVENYELGKPMDKEVKRARQFVDKHMTP